MNIEFLSVPVYVKAVHFLPDGSNYQQVVDLVKMNQGDAKMIFLEKDGSPVKDERMTENTGILLKMGDGAAIVCPPDTHITLTPGEMFPVPHEDWLKYYVALDDVNSITNGQFTFRQLLDKIDEYEPTLELLLMQPHYKLALEKTEVQQFIKEIAITHQDSDGNQYHVINKNIYFEPK